MLYAVLTFAQPLTDEIRDRAIVLYQQDVHGFSVLSFAPSRLSQFLGVRLSRFSTVATLLINYE